MIQNFSFLYILCISDMYILFFFQKVFSEWKLYMANNVCKHFFSSWNNDKLLLNYCSGPSNSQTYTTDQVVPKQLSITLKINYLECNDISVEIGYIWILNGYRNVIQYECSDLIVPFQHLKNGLFAFTDLRSENAVLNLKGQFAFEKWNSFYSRPNIYVLQHGISCIKSLEVRSIQNSFDYLSRLSKYGSGISVPLVNSKYNTFCYLLKWFPISNDQYVLLFRQQKINFTFKTQRYLNTNL